MKKYINIFNRVKIENRKSNNGVVTFDAVIAKAKTHKFHNSELNIPAHFKELDYLDCMYPKEVFENSLESLSYLPITNEHPFSLIMDMEDKDDANRYLGKGITGEATINSDGEIVCKATVTDAELITEILNDKVQLSWGGRVQYNWLSEDEAKEKGYELELTGEIIGDHVALVSNGRCDGDCKIKISENSSMNTSFKDDNKEVIKTIINGLKQVTKTKDKKNSKIETQNNNKGKKMEIILNGKTVTVDENVGKLINDSVGALQGEIMALKKENEKLNKANDELEIIKAQGRLEEVINKAKEMDEDFEPAENASLLDVLNSVMNTEETDEGRAYSAFNSVHNYFVANLKDKKVSQMNAKKEAKTATEDLNNVYDDIFGGNK